MPLISSTASTVLSLCIYFSRLYSPLVLDLYISCMALFSNHSQKHPPKSPRKGLYEAKSEEAAPLTNDKHAQQDSRHAVKSQSKHKDSSRGTFRRWLPELLACCGVLLALVALIVFMSQYDGRPRPQWPYTITINTIVSIFGLILRACLLIPVAEGEMVVSGIL